jgi:D-alanyl-D-alanine carboxypeptidase
MVSFEFPRAWLTRFILICLFVSSAFNLAYAKPQFSAVSVDARTGAILFSNDIDGQRHPASLTKVMTLYVLFQDLKAKRISLNTSLLVSRRASNMSPSKLGLKPGSNISVENAIKALVTRSANDVAATVGENLGGTEANFAARMTRTARAIGMTRSTFLNASGLPNPNQWTTARDMATLSLRIQRDFPQYYPYFRISSFVYKGQVIRTHNKLLGRYQGTDGIKTGYIGASGFNLTTSVKRGDKRIVGVVMGATSNGSRNKYMMKMLDGSLPKCVNGNTIAAKAGSSEGVINPLQNMTQVAEAKPKRKSFFGARPSEPAPEQQVASATVSDVPATEGVTFKSVDASSAEIPSNSDTKVLEAKMEDASNNDTGEEPVEAASEEVASQMPTKLPFAVKKAGDATEGEVVVASIDPTWNIQIGAFSKKEEARQKLMQMKTSGFRFLNGKPALTVEVQKGEETVYRARFSGFNQKTAKAACVQLSKKGMTCETVSPQS